MIQGQGFVFTMLQVCQHSRGTFSVARWCMCEYYGVIGATTCIGLPGALLHAVTATDCSAARTCLHSNIAAARCPCCCGMLLLLLFTFCMHARCCSLHAYMEAQVGMHASSHYRQPQIQHYYIL
jgi:hypothetical protein